MRGFTRQFLIAMAAMLLASCSIMALPGRNAPQSTEPADVPPSRTTADNPARETASARPVSGRYEVVALRRASDVMGGPDDATLRATLSTRADFGGRTVWLGEPCPSPSLAPAESPLANYDDPVLSDIALGNAVPEASWVLSCDGELRALFDQLDAHILVAVSPGGQTYSIFERARTPEEMERIQAQLIMTGQLDGKPQPDWRPEAWGALSRFARAEGSVFTFRRPVISDELVRRLARAASPERIRFPDYTPKTSPDTVLDYRPSLAREIAALPEPGAANITELVTLLQAWSVRARQEPGQFTQGSIARGGEPREYEPSDAELMAFELGTRLDGALWGACDEEGGPDKTGLYSKGDWPELTYPAFTFRHVDVMGSGRFTYASPPDWVVIETPG